MKHNRGLSNGVLNNLAFIDATLGADLGNIRAMKWEHVAKQWMIYAQKLEGKIRILEVTRNDTNL